MRRVDFANFQAAEGVRTPGKILAHIGDLLDWGALDRCRETDLEGLQSACLGKRNANVSLQR